MVGESACSSKSKKFPWRLIFLPCGFFSCSSSNSVRHVDPSNATTASSPVVCSPSSIPFQASNVPEITEEFESPVAISSKKLCTICLEPLLNNSCQASPGQAVFTAQCSHAFHLSCISSNIRHGSVTCPICRAHWTQLPRSLHPPTWLPRNPEDPILRILDHSITTFRVHRRSFLRTARYDDDDPIEPSQAHSYPQSRLSFSIVRLPSPQTQSYFSNHSLCPCSNYSPFDHSPSAHSHSQCFDIDNISRRSSSESSSSGGAYLSVKLAQQQAIDMVLVASPNGSHLRLLKQSMAMVVFSLRPEDRLAIVSYSSAAARIFPLRRMTAYGKRGALHVIDRLFYTGHSDPAEGIKKGIKILRDRVHSNPLCSILHLSEHPTRTVESLRMETRTVPIRRFHVSSAGSIVREIEEFLEGLMGGGIRETQLRIGDEGEEARIVRVGEMRGEEERRVLLDMEEFGPRVCVGYSYVEDGVLGMDECIRTGEAVVAADGGGGGNEIEGHHAVGVEGTTVAGGRRSGVEREDFHDPYMARRWAKRLHGRHRF